MREKASASPALSVLMTAWNAAPFLAEAIESVLRQETATAWELLFVDDGSTDETLAIALQYAALWPRRIRVLQHDKGANCGISASRNLALRNARGRYIAFLDADDVWLPHHVETMLPLLEAMPQVAMVYAGAERWVHAEAPFHEAAARAASWGSNYLPPLTPAGESAGLLQPGKLLQWFQSDESLVPCICSVVVRAEAARAVDGFCEEFRGLYDDQAFHAKIAARYWIYAHDACVARYRQHPASCCARARAETHTGSDERARFLSFLAANPQIRDAGNGRSVEGAGI